MYTFNVRVEDGGIPALSDDAEVEITITKSPGISFTPPFSQYSVNEDVTIGYLIENVQANNGGTNVRFISYLINVVLMFP